VKYSNEKSIEFLAILDVVFTFLLVMSGSFVGIMSTIFYIIAFILPIIVGIYYTRENNNAKEFLDVRGIKAAAPFIAPTIGVVMFIAFLVSLLIGLITGKSNVVDLGDNLIVAILSHALLPAILEEALFRFVPMRALRGKSWAVIVFYSALFFALIHHSLFSMPYAFIAGVVFMIIDLAFDSVWPSVIIHFLNNVISVLFFFYGASPAFCWGVILGIILLSVASIIYIVKNFKRYEKIKEKIADLSELKLAPPKEIWFLAIPMLILAVMELI
jgi:membrane protease YdiL (CAAX protease family)